MTSESLAKYGDFVNEKIQNSALTSESYVGNDNLLGNFQGITHSEYVPESGTSNRFRKGDILIGNIRPYLRKIWLANIAGGASNDVLVFRAKNPSDANYLFYCLTTEDFISHVMTGSKGTKMPRGDKNHILKYEVPKFSEQDSSKISKFFSLVDLKIENNLRICRNLEMLGREYFKLTANQSTGEKIEYKLADVLKKRSEKFSSNVETPTIDLSVMPSNSIVLFDTNSSINFDTNLFVLRKGDFLVGAIRPYLKKIGIAPFDGALTGTVLGFESLDKTLDAFLLFLLDSQDFKQYLVSCSKGTKMPVVDTDIVLNYSFSTTVETIKGFNLYYNFNSVITGLVSENNVLKQIKNSLLPITIAGKIKL